MSIYICNVPFSSIHSSYIIDLLIISGLNFVSAACGRHLLQKVLTLPIHTSYILNGLTTDWENLPELSSFSIWWKKFCRELAIIRTTQQYPQTSYFQTSINECCCLKFTNHILAMSDTLITFPPVIQQNL